MMKLLALSAALIAVIGVGPAQRPPTPVLVELFTSEGCSSCPPADALLAKLLRDQPIAGVAIVPLSLHVDYWDHQGWKDPFSSKIFTDRQKAYSKIFGEDRVYTPQMVVDGREEFTGSDEAAARRGIETAASRPHLPLRIDARTAGQSVRLSLDLPAAPPNAEKSEKIDVIVALAEDDLTTAVQRGENGGKKLTHVAVVRRLQTMGTLEGEAFVADGQLELNRTWKAASMRAVAWMQGQQTRHVYGAASVPLTR